EATGEPSSQRAGIRCIYRSGDGLWLLAGATDVAQRVPITSESFILNAEAFILNRARDGSCPPRSDSRQNPGKSAVYRRGVHRRCWRSACLVFLSSALGTCALLR